ncbi:hypothetical protein ABZ391_19255, partial [Kitasatospora cineracea]
MTAVDLGYITTPRQGDPVPPGPWWAADNCRYGKPWPGTSRWWDRRYRQVQRNGPDHNQVGVAAT